MCRTHPRLTDIQKYPRRMAALLVGTADPVRVGDILSEFARTDYDTVRYIKHIPRICRAVFRASGPVRLSTALQRRIEDLAYAARAASVNWRVRTGRDSDAALLIWMSALCCCESTDYAGFDSCLYGLTAYALSEHKRDAILDVVLEALGDLFLGRSWDACLSMMVMYAAVALAAEQTERASETVREKLARMEGPGNLPYLLPDWWCAQKRSLSECGERELKQRVDSAVGAYVSTLPEQLGEIRRQISHYLGMITDYYGKQ